MTLLWATDIHLNFVRAQNGVKAFGEYLSSVSLDAAGLVITGDISEAPTLARHLKELASGFERPIYFVIGNHDLYKGSIRGVHEALSKLNVPNLVWLDQAEPVLFDDFALVGKYSWYDALNGRPQTSPVVLYDFQSVGEFRRVYNEYDWEFMARTGSRNALLKLLRKYAKEAVDEVRPKLEQALAVRQHVIFATHVAPFEGAAWHEGKPSDPDWQPWFSCKQMGDMLLEVAAQHPDHKILVLCGHSHSPGEYQAAPNLKILTGKAVYGAPDIAGLIDASAFEGW